MSHVGFCYPFNFSGHPGLTVPSGLTDSGLPSGVQFVARRHDDALLVATAGALHEALLAASGGGGGVGLVAPPPAFAQAAKL